MILIFNTTLLLLSKLNLIFLFYSMNVRSSCLLRRWYGRWWTSWERQLRRWSSHSWSWRRWRTMPRKSLRSSKTRRCFPFLTEAQAKERRKGRKTESVLDNIRVIASIYNAVQFIYRSKSLQELFLLTASLFLFFDFHNLSISFLHLSQDRDSHQLTTSS